MEAFDDDGVEASDDESLEGAPPGGDGMHPAAAGSSDSEEEAPDDQPAVAESDDDGDTPAAAVKGARPGKAARDGAAAAVADVQLDQELLLLDGPEAREENLLQLQVDELLREASFDCEDPAIAATFDKLTALLRGIPEQRVTAAAAPEYLACFPDGASASLDFRPPERVALVGAAASRTLLLPEPALDLLLAIPAACLWQKSYLNHGYHAKRALWLATVAAALKRHKAFAQQRWELWRGDPRKPVLLLRVQPKGGGQPFRLRLLTSIPPAAFPLQKLRPNRNCLRSMAAAAPAGSAAESKLLPTPQYNNSILQDMFPERASQAVADAAAAMPGFRDGVMLLKVWSRQHGLEGAADDCGGDFLAAFAAHCAAAGKLAAAMRPLQLFKAVLRQLGSAPLAKSGACMARGPAETQASAQQQQQQQRQRQQPPPLALWREAFDVVLVDPSGWVNLAAHVSKPALQQAQAAARRTLALLASPASAESAFQAAFLPRLSPAAAFDCFWRVSPPPPQQQQRQQQAAGELLGRDWPLWRLQERRLLRLCSQALGTRVTCLRVFSRLAAEQPALGAPALASPCILLAAQVDPLAYDRLVDLGPAGDSAEAPAFRAFWGPRAELRRFQDGRICEAVAWQISPSERHRVPDLVVRAALERHAPGWHAQGFSGLLDWALRRADATADEVLAARRQMEAAQTRLGKQLRSLAGLTLRIVAVSPLSSVAGQTAVGQPLPHPFAGGPKADAGAGVPRCLQPVELFVQLEGSGRWPDDPEAFGKAKAALGVQLAGALFTGFGLRAEASEDCVDCFADGFAFRLFLHSDRDAAMASRHPGSAAAAAHTQRQRAAAHQGLVSQVAAAHPSFRAAARLAARWASAHLASNHLPPQAVELLAAAAYCPGSALPPPGTALAGLLRFLRLLGSHSWRERPLVIDPDGSLPAASGQACLSAFSKAREQGCAPALPIATPADPAAAHWTVARPDAQVAGRLAALARRSAALLQEAVELGAPAPEAAAAAAFDPCLPDFDAAVLLRREALPTAALALCAPGSSEGGPAALEAQLRAAGFGTSGEGEAEPAAKLARAVLGAIPPDVAQRWGKARLQRELLVGFDPLALLLQRLEGRFGHLGSFFADADGGRAIAVKWRPQAFEARPLAPETAHASLPLRFDAAPAAGGEEGQPRKKRAKTAASVARTVPDVLRVVGEIRALGAGLVADVRLRRDAGL